jgi:hypothetical protein
LRNGAERGEWQGDLQAARGEGKGKRTAIVGVVDPAEEHDCILTGISLSVFIERE